MTTNESNLNPIRVLLIDDEIEACDNLRHILHTYVDASIEILGVAYDTTEAERKVKALKPDAVFLDIEMPDENAFQFLERIKPFDFEIIFVTAYDHFAIKAFKLNAVDYILKPICIDELTDAVKKLRNKLQYRKIVANTDYEIEVLRQIAQKEKQQKIALRTFNQIEMVDFMDIYFIEAQGSYCRFCFRKANKEAEVTISNSISEYEELFPSEYFYRVHKSYLVNCIYITRISSDPHYELVSNNKHILPVSRRRYPQFIQFLEQNKFYSV